ncbi:LOW QUALITY PROTEIN: hypothetical protein PV04_07120 [Phialophora macrospora]|uniref:Uncharacterized protein n=1 Tax=Phialophora macrospora TaxID=1851006 RepID=A0A0D2FMM1_9EURO|nr:LOW QUALITY PROTEIN: hypothetical protein PV04_07120 [Phialophora macrospora]
MEPVTVETISSCIFTVTDRCINESNYDSTKYLNTPSNVWLHIHSTENKNNVEEGLGVTFTGDARYTLMTSAERNICYKERINYIAHSVLVSYLGVAGIKNKIRHGIIFLDDRSSLTWSVTPPHSLRRGRDH